jgi:signal-transduction protein with cAMP-binding, CBS, and nucleotidyltransferase domain
MATSPIPVLLQAPQLGVTTFAPGDTTAYKTVFTGNTNGSKVVGLLVTSTDTAARVMVAQINRAGANTNLCASNVAALSGTDGVTSVTNMMSSSLFPGLPLDNDGQPYFFLQSGDILQLQANSTITAAKNIYVTVVAGNF